MNKKVLTLCVSALLASTVMASAADPVLPQDYVPVTITPGKVIGDAVENLPLESDGKLYHLAAEGVYVGGEKSDISVQNQVFGILFPTGHQTDRNSCNTGFQTPDLNKNHADIILLSELSET